MATRIGGSIVIAGGGYLLLWLVTRARAIAFGDVRLMPLIGAVAGTMGWSGLYWSVLLGSVVGAAVGVVRLIIGRRGPFPYGPALVSGPYAAALLISVLQ
jgi:leader peptidase (prepilin peptidase)/N-methyltransferase